MKQLINIKRFLLWLLCLICAMSAAQARIVYVINFSQWTPLNAWIWQSGNSGSWTNAFTFYGTWLDETGQGYNIYSLTTANNIDNIIVAQNSESGDKWGSANDKPRTNDISFSDGNVIFLDENNNAKYVKSDSLEDFLNNKNGSIVTVSDGAVEIPYLEFNAMTCDFIIAGSFTDYNWNLTNEKYKMVRHQHESDYVEWIFSGEIKGNKEFHIAQFNNEWNNKLYIKNSNESQISNATGSVGMNLTNKDGSGTTLKFTKDFEGTIILKQSKNNTWSLSWIANRLNGNLVNHELYIKGEGNIDGGLSWGTNDPRQKFTVTQITNGNEYSWEGFIDNNGPIKFATKDELFQLGFDALLTELPEESGTRELQVINHHNYCFPWITEPTRMKFVLTQTDEGWSMHWERVDVEPLTEYSLLVKGGGLSEDGEMTCTTSVTKNTYTWSGTLANSDPFTFETADGAFKLGLNDSDYQISDYTVNDKPLVAENAHAISFTKAKNTPIEITLTQTHEGWTMSWSATEPVYPTKRDLYIRGDKNINNTQDGWYNYPENRKLNCNDSDPERLVYTWTGTIDNSSVFNFGTSNGSFHLSLADGISTILGGSGSANMKTSDGNDPSFSWADTATNKNVTITIVQTNNGTEDVWVMSWQKEDDPTPDTLEEYTLYVRGEATAGNGWDIYNPAQKMTCQKGEDQNVYTWKNTIKGQFNIGVQDKTLVLGLNESVTTLNATQGGPLDMTVGDNHNIQFSFAENTAKTIEITVVQTSEKWTISWKAEGVVEQPEIIFSPGIDHTLIRYDITIENGDDDPAIDKNNNLMSRVKVKTDDFDGYEYRWQGTIWNEKRIHFKGINSDIADNTEIWLGGNEANKGLQLSYAQDAKENLVIVTRSGDVVIDSDKFFHFFHEGTYLVNAEVRIILRQQRYGEEENPTDEQKANGKWSMEWWEVTRPSTVDKMGGVYLHGSELNNWDNSKRRAFVWDPELKLYVLKYQFENSSVDVLDYDGDASSMMSNTLTNYFYIEAFGEKLTVENGVNSPIVTGKSTQLTTPAEGSDVGVDHTDNCMILKDKALEEVTLYYNPTTKRLRVEGDVSDEIDARKYTVYYKITEADKNSDGSMKDIYLWAWGNGDDDRSVLSTLKNDAVNGVDAFDNGNLTFPGIKISDPAHGKIINVDGETYIRYTLDIPEGQTTLGVIFSHTKDEQMKNILDTDFQDGRIYGWNTVFNQGKQDFFAKVGIRYLDKNGNKAMLLLNTNDGNIYTLDGVDMNHFYQGYTAGFVQDWKEGSLLAEPLYAANEDQRSDINLSEEYAGFYIVRSPASTETNDYTQGSIIDYTYYFTHNGGIAYHKTYNLSATAGQCTHIHWNETDKGWEHDTTDLNYNQLTNKPMTFNSEDVDRLSFWFELSTGRLRVSREEGDIKESTARIVLYFKNDTGFEKPYIHVQSVDGKVYTSETRVKGKDGKIYTVGQAMHQDDSRLGVDNNYWRYELRVPDYELKKGGKKVESSESDEPAMLARKAPMFNDDPFISPTNYFEATHLHSNLIFTFTDGKNPTAPISNADKYNNGAKQIKKFADGTETINQMHYVPVVHGGIYTLDNNSQVNTEDVKGQIYLINANTNQKVATLEQTKAGDYIFEGNVNLWNSFSDGKVSVYVTTEIDGDSNADGVDYGAGDSPKDVTNTLNSSGVSDDNMVYTSSEPFTINLNDITKDGFNSNSTMAVRVTINPTLHTGGIGFSLSGDDFQTSVEDIEDADAPVMWFNPQGIRLDAPKQGLNIRVQGKKASKIWIR